MARVNVEARAMAESRFFNLMGALGFSRIETVGLLVVFWYDTQERVLVEANAEDLMRLLPVKTEERQRVFDALLNNDYLKALPNGKYEIKGNRRQVAYLVRQRELGARGGKKSGEARRETSPVVRGVRDQARYLFAEAVGKGIIARGERCERCGGTNKIDGHHRDYSKPLEVEWLCRNCHRNEHLNEAVASKVPTTPSSVKPNSIQFNSIQSDSIQFNSRKDVSSEQSKNDCFRAIDQLRALEETLVERKVTTHVQTRWLDAFPDPPWVISTVRKALAWESANPKRRKKEFGRFITAWLTRDWDKRRDLPPLPTEVKQRPEIEEIDREFARYEAEAAKRRAL